MSTRGGHDLVGTPALLRWELDLEANPVRVPLACMVGAAFGKNRPHPLFAQGFVRVESVLGLAPLKKDTTITGS